MKPKFKSKKRLIVKIFFLLLTIGAFANLIIFVGGRTVFHRSDFSERLLRIAGDRLVEAVCDDIGAPPNPQSVAAFVRKWGVDVRVENRSGLYISSSSALPALTDLPLQRRFQSRFGKWEDLFFIVHYRNGYRYGFFIEQSGIVDFDESLFIALSIAGVSGVMLMAFGGLHYLLRPLRYLQDATQQIADGNLDIHVPEKSEDELGTLSKSFNHMASRLKQTIQSKEQLLLDASHELRTPITRMKVALEFLPENKHKDGLLEDVRAMEHLVTEVLETARLRSGTVQLNLAQHDLVTIAREAAKQIFAEEGIVHWETEPSLLMTCDKPKMFLVFKNLFENANKYASAERPLEVFVTAKKLKNSIEIEIRDNGIGIAEADLDNVFDAFYRVDKARTPNPQTGYGLGLGLVKRVVEQHRGQIQLSSQVKIGTKVVLVFGV